jgi:orotidine-5'-phosphate decarboxylase
MGAGFADRLAGAVERSGTPACVGLDPVLEKLPEGLRGGEPAAALEEFCLGVIRACRGMVGVMKPQSACFERYGSAGMRVLERVCHAAREAEMVVILDAKRGDIGFSAEHYASAAAGIGADAITLHGYMGMETVEPYLRAGLGVFVLVRTSNPGSDGVQGRRMEDGRSVAEMMADEVAGLGEQWMGAGGRSDVGAVVGATKSAEGRALRARMPRAWLLVPGYGAQGGTVDDVRALLDERRGGVVVNASRSVIYACGGKEWEGGVRAAAGKFAEELRGLAAPRPT